MQRAKGYWSGAALAGVWFAAARLSEPALRLVLALRVRQGKEIAARLPERRGIDLTQRPAGRLLWMHAASVGETISLLPVLHALALIAPDVRLLLTTGTVTSAEIAAARLPVGALHRFVPLDVPRWVARFLDHWRPQLGCFVESEIWPNTVAAAAARGIPLALLNARLSEASFRHWRRAPGFARRLLARFALIRARSPADAMRFTALAGHPVEGSGDLKFAAPLLPADATALGQARAAIGDAPVWVAASVHPGEDTVVAAVHERLRARYPGLVTIVVPRHPRRGAAMAAAHRVARRSSGELFYRLAACAFVGGSLVAHGGQNPLEPARLGLPVAMGPSNENFAEACAVLRETGVLTEVSGPDQLAAWVDRMFSDTPARIAAGRDACAAAQRWADLPDRSARALLTLMSPQ
jgi:3-deoxy-D-manno-octulosonic-acid transferase